MAEVIKQGKPWSKVFKYLGNITGEPACGAKILFTMLDIYPTFTDRETRGYGRFICPECGEETGVEIEAYIPQGVKPTLEEIQEIKNKWKEKIRNWKKLNK